MAPKKKKILKYSKEAMAAALEAVRSGGMSRHEASRRFGVPRTTLKDKLNGRYGDAGSIGRKPFLSPEEEDGLAG